MDYDLDLMGLARSFLKKIQCAAKATSKYSIDTSWIWILKFVSEFIYTILLIPLAASIN